MGRLDGRALNPGPRAPQTLGNALRQAARELPSRGITVLERDGRENERSYASLRTAAEQLARGLRRAGVRSGDVVVLRLRGIDNQLLGFWATVFAGAVALPAFNGAETETPNPPGSTWQLVTQASDVRPDATDRTLALDALVPDSGGPLPTPRPDDLVLLLETSGSTGTPKRVMHTHRTLLARCAATTQANGFAPTDVSLNWLPLDHVGGLVMFHLRDVYVRCPQIHAASELVLANPLRWLAWIERFGATVTWAPNFAYAMVSERALELDAHRRDLSTLRFLLNGGEPIVPRQARRFLRLLEPHRLDPECMFPAWGMSETASGVVYARDFSPSTCADEDASVAVGTPLPGASVRVVDAHGALRPAGESGLLEVRGPSVTPGYHQNPEATADAFTADGWFRTGDTAHVRDGRLTITGREKDVIIVNGANHACLDVEHTVDAAAGVVPSHTCAVAVRGDEDSTDQVLVFVTPSAGSDPDEVVSDVRARLRRTHGIGTARVILLEPSEIPRTSIGKIVRRTLKERFLAGHFDERSEPAPTDDSPSTAANGSDRVHDIVRRVLHLPSGQIDPTKPLQEQVGLDSLSLLEVVSAIEKEFGIRLRTDRMTEDVSLHHLTGLLHEARGSTPATP